ncbi:unnamed protein product, partial [Prorocentrum cordatum]
TDPVLSDPPPVALSPPPLCPPPPPVLLLPPPAKGVLYAAADTVFVQAPMQFFKRDYPGSHMVVTANNVMKENPETCTDVADKYEKAEAGQLRDRLRIYRRSLTGEEDSARFDINSGLIFAQNSPGTADVMLRSWMLLVTRGSAENTQHWALQQAIQELP